MDAILTLIEVVRWCGSVREWRRGPAAAGFSSRRNSCIHGFAGFDFGHRPIRKPDAVLANLVCLPVHLRGIRACLVYCADRLTQGNNSRIEKKAQSRFSRLSRFLSRAFWWEQRQNAARMSVIARLGLVPSARRTVNLTSRINSGPSLATPAFRANRSRKLVRAFASNNENCCDTPSMQNVPGTCSRPRDDPDGSCHQSTQSQRH